MTDEKKDFVVKDRRVFAGEAGEPTPQDDTPSAGEEAPPLEEPAASAGEGPRLPKIDFATFILSLNSSALVQLGLLEDPSSGQKDKNLPLAKQTIDIIGLLEEKTRGNLSRDEEHMLRSILYDLRMLYVKEKS